MAIKSCFIGIDKYLDPGIRDLTGAVKDATVLWSLFSDTVPSIQADILCNEHATFDHVKNSLSSLLESATQEDTIIISFSGHGTNHHRLVTHNTSKAALDDTTVSMDELAGLFRKSKANAILFILDCCFSGAVPARVIEDSPVPRQDTFSFESFAGKGRILIAASSANEPAFELPGCGHGLLTKALIDALQTTDDQVNLASAMDKITQMVRAEAARIGVTQTPVWFGFIEGGLTFPSLRPGANFYKAFPESKGIRISKAIADLQAFGISAPILIEWARNFKNGLNNLQLEAVNKHRILDGQSLLVVAPTSSGKTFIGEMAAAKAISKGEKVIFLLPYRALVNEKYDSFVQLYTDNLGIRVLRCTGDYSDETGPFVRGKYEIAILTFEMFLNLVLGNPTLLSQIGLIVLDEAQFITDPTRGITVELLLTFLLANAEKGIRPQIIALSAVIGGINDFDQWLGVEAMISYERPVPLEEGVMDRSGNFQFLTPIAETKITSLISSYNIVQRGKNPSQQDMIVPLMQFLMKDLKEKVIIFRNTRGPAEGCAGYLSRELGLLPANDVIAQLPNHDLSTTSMHLRECLSGGVAFHNTNLNRIEKAIIERSFRDPAGKIRVLVATTTLAAGINTPASTVVLAEQEFIGEDNRPFSIAEYKNMAGRAGRLGFNEDGKAIILAEQMHETQVLFKRYVLGKPEALSSSFDSENVETWIIRLLAQIKEVPRHDIVRLLANTYGGYLANRQNPGWRESIKQHLEELMVKMLSLGLLEQEGDLVRLTLLGRVCGQSSLSLQSAMRLVELLKSLGMIQVSSEFLMAIVQGLPESDNTYTPLFKRGSKESGMPRVASARVGNVVVNLLQKFAGGEMFTYYARCKRVAILFDWINGVPTERIEAEYTMNPYQGKVGYGDIRRFADATRYHLRTVAPIASLILVDRCPTGESIDILLKQLEVGVPRDSLDLLKLPIGFERGEYLALYGKGIKTYEAFWAVPGENLIRILGSDRAAEIEKARSKLVVK